MAAEPVTVPADFPVADAIHDSSGPGSGAYPVPRDGRGIGRLDLAQVKAAPTDEQGRSAA
jgi:CBS domain-containing protein